MNKYRSYAGGLFRKFVFVNNNNNILFSLSCTSILLLCSLPHISYVTIMLFWMKARRTVGLKPVNLGFLFVQSFCVVCCFKEYYVILWHNNVYQRKCHLVLNILHFIVHKLAFFCYFECRIRIMRLDLSFQKTKIPVFEFTTYWFSDSGVITTTPTEPTVSERHRKTFSSIQSCLTDSTLNPISFQVKSYQYIQQH